jgi:drug/metabolite transporter (DMT)-like permease
MANSPSSLGLPAGDARRAARFTSARRWQALMTVATAAVIAFAYANPFNGLTSLLSIVFLVGFVAVNRPNRGVRPPATVRQSSWLSWVVLFAMVFVVFFVAIALRNALAPGSALAFAVQFLSAVILLSIGSAMCAYLEARRRRKHLSAGAQDDDLHG